MSDQQPTAVNFQIEVADEVREGHYANFLSIWHSQHDFTFDFAVTEQPIAGGLDGEPGSVTVPCKVVSRVRIPASAIEDVLRAIAQDVTEYENQVGRIRRPGSDEAAG